MQTRRELYQLIGYHDYEALDDSIARSVLPDEHGDPAGTARAWRSIESGSTRRPPASPGRPSSPGSSPPSPRGAAALGVDADVAEMVACRVVDNAAVALAALDRRPVAVARAMALAHPRPAGATLFGLPPTTTVHAEWAAWANGTAVRELDFHDTFLAADYAHPADSIPPLVAVAQQKGVGRRAAPRRHRASPTRST